MSLWRRVYEERKPVVLPLLILIALNAAVFVGLLLPLRQAVTAAASAREDARFALFNAQLRHKQAKDALAAREQADRDLRTFYQDILPRDQAMATRVTNLFLAQAARADGLSFGSSSASQTAERDSRLWKASATVSLLGPYPNIRKFLHAVEAAEEFVIIDRVELSESEQNRPGAGAPLTVQLLVSSYYPMETAR
jgi:hypothetical protein